MCRTPFFLITIAVVVTLQAGLTAQIKTSAQQPSAQPFPSPKPTVSPRQDVPAEGEIDPADVVRVRTSLVNSPVLVIGRDGRYVPHLRREDFQVFEDGVRQEIAYFAPVDRPFTTAVLMDTSRSARFKIQDIQSAAIAFVESMRPHDQALIISFADQIKVLAEATNDKDVLRRAIRNAVPGGGTRVYDAIDFAVKSLNQIEGRKAMILLSDGVDTASRDATLESTLLGIEKSQALVYPVQFSTFEFTKDNSGRKRRPAPEGSGFSKSDYQRADVYLHQVAERTGTALYPAYEIGDLERAVSSIVDELHNEYSIGYYPQVSGKAGEERRLEVRVNQPQLVVRARTGYVIDQSGVVLTSAGGQKPAITITPSGTAFMPLPRSFDREKISPGARWICESTNVPTDYALIKEGFSYHCPPSARANDNTNAWFIRKPTSSETMCKGFLIWRGVEMAGAPIPTGYVVTSEADSPVCGKSPNLRNAWIIQLPKGRMTVCKGFSIPRGFVVIGEKPSAACPAKPFEKNAWVIEPRWDRQ